MTKGIWELCITLALMLEVTQLGAPGSEVGYDNKGNYLYDLCVCCLGWNEEVGFFFFFCPSEPEMQPSTRSCPVLNISSCDLPISHANALLVQVQLYTVQFGAAQEPGSVCSVLQKIQVPGQSRKTKRWF